MMTEIIKTDSDFNNGINKAAAAIRRGGLVIFPTETVYGLGADATSAAAAQAIYAAKGRPSDNPLIIHVANPEDAEPYAETNEHYYRLAKHFMPGPLTVILPRKDTIPPQTAGGLDTVAVRCPSHPVANALIAAAGGAAAFAGGKRMKKLAVAKSADIVIMLDGKSATLHAMTDTGNMLTDPLSGRGVALCELDAVKDLFSHEIIEYWRKGDFSANLAPSYAKRLRFIPSRGALSGKTALLAAVEADVVTISNDRGKREVDILIAPVPYNLSAGESRALLPPGLVD